MTWLRKKEQPVIVIKNRRIALFLAPLLAIFLIIGNQNLAIAAGMSHDVLAKETFDEKSQTLSVSDTSTAPTAAERGTFDVTLLDMIQWPVPSTSNIGNGFGYISNPCDGCSSFHKGADIFGGNGTAVYPVTRGVVTFAGEMGTMGMTVEVEHVIGGVPVKTVYGHLQSNLSVSEGQTVGLDTVLGLVGQTGAATAPVLNFSVYVNGGVTDPVKWLRAHANV